jgi:hypothetical protein
MNRAGVIRATKVVGLFVAAAIILLALELILGILEYAPESEAVSLINGPAVPGLERS